MTQVALTTLFFSLLGIVVVVGRRLFEIAAIPIEQKGESRKRFFLLWRIWQSTLGLFWRIAVFFKNIGLWVVHFSLEKTLRKVRIAALKIENFSARKLENMRAHSRGIPRFSFFEDLINKGDKK